MLVGQDWVDNHLETFIRPKLGCIPELPLRGNVTLNQFKPNKEIGILRAIWREAKIRCKGRPILLAGRDVFLLELLARLEGYPTTFRSDISSDTRGHIQENYKEHFLVDTGYRGSVPTALGMKHWALINYDPAYPKPAKEVSDPYQLFPKARPWGGVRGMASKLESSPKYWTHASYSGGRYIRRLAAMLSFSMLHY